MTQVSYPHYFPPRGKAVDRVIHLAGLAFAVVGGAVLLGLSCTTCHRLVLAVSVYAFGFVAMLAASMGYSFAEERRLSLMRRLDHAGIFLMIAGSYTPFTTHVLTGAWAWGMTSAVWGVAGAGIAFKLFRPDVSERLSVAIYVALGWLVVFAAGPIIQGASPAVLWLLVGGGLVYTCGVVFHVHEDWPFARPIWHGHVLVGAAMHWMAVLLVVVSATS